VKVIACDQSLTGTAFAGLDDGKQFLLETVTHDNSVKGFDRIARILTRLRAILTEHSPEVFVMEDYSGGANVNTMIPLVELGGCIKLVLHEFGYVTGREALIRGEKVLMIQAVSSMKKFMLGHGNVTKDTSYLLKVHQKLAIAFNDDNQADAYMHASMAGLVYKVTRGEVPIGNLTATQQEALISHGVKRQKGLSMLKAMKLSDKEKLALAGF
jgi:Holliday junction resolvasome RuvABC endonuclease subunit